MAGHGRGFYGKNQLDRAPRSGWVKFVVIAGLGTAAWLFWPRRAQGVAGPAEPAPLDEVTLGHIARARGFPSGKAFEDAMVASARELRAADGKVELPAHFRYLERRV
jgi:hypothetical protein